MTCAPRELIVVLDDLVAGLGGGVRIDSERLDPELVPDRFPDEAVLPADRDPLQFVEVDRSHGASVAPAVTAWTLADRSASLAPWISSRASS